MAEVQVQRITASADGSRFHVVVREGDSSSEHDVTATAADLDRLAAAYPSAEAFIRACFDFLLEREPKASILPTFDVAAIGGYFPEFERTISRQD